MRKRVQPTVGYRAGTRVPEGVSLYEVPLAAAVEGLALARQAVFFSASNLP
jgi:hypothetical protein